MINTKIVLAIMSLFSLKSQTELHGLAPQDRLREQRTVGLGTNGASFLSDRLLDGREDIGAIYFSLKNHSVFLRPQCGPIKACDLREKAILTVTFTNHHLSDLKNKMHHGEVPPNRADTRVKRCSRISLLIDHVSLWRGSKFFGANRETTDNCL